jgi:hypothetical protein
LISSLNSSLSTLIVSRFSDSLKTVFSQLLNSKQNVS